MIPRSKKFSSTLVNLTNSARAHESTGDGSAESRWRQMLAAMLAFRDGKFFGATAVGLERNRRTGRCRFQ
jgi:hypothetical protein